jgi:hypothetical protein
MTWDVIHLKLARLIRIPAIKGRSHQFSSLCANKNRATPQAFNVTPAVALFTVFV